MKKVMQILLILVCFGTIFPAVGMKKGKGSRKRPSDVRPTSPVSPKSRRLTLPASLSYQKDFYMYPGGPLVDRSYESPSRRDITKSAEGRQFPSCGRGAFLRKKK